MAHLCVLYLESCAPPNASTFPEDDIVAIKAAAHALSLVSAGDGGYKKLIIDWDLGSEHIRFIFESSETCPFLLNSPTNKYLLADY